MKPISSQILIMTKQTVETVEWKKQVIIIIKMLTKNAKTN